MYKSVGTIIMVILENTINIPICYVCKKMSHYQDIRFYNHVTVHHTTCGHTYYKSIFEQKSTGRTSGEWGANKDRVFVKYTHYIL